MRFKGRIDMAALYTVVLFVFTSFVSTQDVNSLPFLSETYHEAKNIAFVGAIGGASHYNWVLTILDELSERKHNVTFFTNVSFKKYLFNLFLTIYFLEKRMAVLDLEIYFPI
jgi:hypothetical protein